MIGDPRVYYCYIPPLHEPDSLFWCIELPDASAFEHRSRTLPSLSASKEEVGEPSRGSQRWRAALDLLSEMEERGLAPDVVAYNRVINVLRWAGQRERALDVLEGMKRRSAGGLSRVRPDVITYNSAIAACAAGSE